MATQIQVKNKISKDPKIMELFFPSPLLRLGKNPREISRDLRGFGLQAFGLQAFDKTGKYQNTKKPEPGRAGLMAPLVTRDTFDFREAKNRVVDFREAKNRVVNFLAGGSLLNLIVKFSHKNLELVWRHFAGNPNGSLFVKNTGPGGGSVPGRIVDSRLTLKNLGFSSTDIQKYRERLNSTEKNELCAKNQTELAAVLNIAITTKPNVWNNDIIWTSLEGHKALLSSRGKTVIIDESRDFIDIPTPENETTRLARKKSGKAQGVSRYVGVSIGKCLETPEATKKHMFEISKKLSDVFGHPIKLITYPQMEPGSPILINDSSLVNMIQINPLYAPEIFNSTHNSFKRHFPIRDSKGTFTKPERPAIVTNPTGQPFEVNKEKIKLTSSKEVYIVCGKGGYEAVHSRADDNIICRLNQLPNGTYDRLTQDQYGLLILKKQDGMPLPTRFGACVVVNEQGTTHYNVDPQGKMTEHNQNGKPSFSPNDPEEKPRYALDGKVLPKEVYHREANALDRGFKGYKEEQAARAAEKQQDALRAAEAPAPAFGLSDEYSKGM
jgi:hypothetical protein